MTGFSHTLYFVRHGETDWNRAGRLQGQTEIELNSLGRAQAARNGETLAELMSRDGIDVAVFPFVASPMKRVRQTAEIVRQRLGLMIDGYPTDDRLKEIAFGEHEGFTPADLKQRFPDHHRARKTDRWRYAPPGGESYAELSDRVGEWLSGIDADTIVVAHGGISRVLRGHLLGLKPEDVMGLEVPQDRVMVASGGRCDWV